MLTYFRYFWYRIFGIFGIFRFVTFRNISLMDSPWAKSMYNIVRSSFSRDYCMHCHTALLTVYCIRNHTWLYYRVCVDTFHFCRQYAECITYCNNTRLFKGSIIFYITRFFIILFIYFFIKTFFIWPFFIMRNFFIRTFL